MPSSVAQPSTTTAEERRKRHTGGAPTLLSTRCPPNVRREGSPPANEADELLARRTPINIPAIRSTTPTSIGTVHSPKGELPWAAPALTTTAAVYDEVGTDYELSHEVTGCYGLEQVEQTLSEAITCRVERIASYAARDEQEGVDTDEGEGAKVQAVSGGEMRAFSVCSPAMRVPASSHSSCSNTRINDEVGEAEVGSRGSGTRSHVGSGIATKTYIAFSPDPSVTDGVGTWRAGAGESASSLTSALKQSRSAQKDESLTGSASPRPPSPSAATATVHLPETSLLPAIHVSGQLDPEARRQFHEYIRNSREEFLRTYYNSPRARGMSLTDPSTTRRSHGSPSGTPGSTGHGLGLESRGEAGLPAPPPLSYSRVMCPEGEEALDRCINPTRRGHRWRRSEGSAPSQAVSVSSSDEAPGAEADAGTGAGGGGRGAGADVDRCEGNTRAPSLRALKNLAAMSYGPFKWGSTRDQCMWIYQKLIAVVRTGRPVMMLRATLVLLHLLHYGSREMLSVMYENQDEFFDTSDAHWRSLSVQNSPIVSLLHLLAGFVISLTDLLHSVGEVVAENPEHHSPAGSLINMASQEVSSPVASEPAAVPARDDPGTPKGSPLPWRFCGGGPGVSVGTAAVSPTSPYGSVGVVNVVSLARADPTIAPMVYQDDPGRCHARSDAAPLNSFPSRLSATSGACVSDGRMPGNILQQGTYESWLQGLSQSQRQHLLYSLYELLKGGTTVEYLDTLAPGKMTPVEDYTVATYVVTLRAVFSCVAVIVEGYLEPKNNPCFRHLSREEEVSRAHDWALAVVGYERTLWRLSRFFAWAASLNLRSPVQIPKLRPLPASFLPRLGARLMKAYKGSRREGTVSAALRHAAIQQRAMPELTAACTTPSSMDQPRAADSVPGSDDGRGHPLPTRRSDRNSAPVTCVEGGDGRRALDGQGSASSQSSGTGSAGGGGGASGGAGRQSSHRRPIGQHSLSTSSGGGVTPTPTSEDSGHLTRPVDISREFYPRTGAPFASIDSSTGSEPDMAHFINRKREQRFMIIAGDAGCHKADDVDRFRIFRTHILGRGTFGTVLKAWDELRGSFLACKEIIMDRDTSNEEATMAALFREYSLLTSLRHPNIVGVVGFVVDNNRGHIFMEWMPSGSIQAVLELLGEGFRENVVRRFVRDALRGIEYLHSKGIIHRDVKPGNMLLDAAGVLKLTDFGSSRSVLQSGASESATLQTFSVVGTLAYIAPDSVRGNYSYASDIWSLGCSALHMATGKPPWGDVCTECVALIFKIGSLTEGNHLPTMPKAGTVSPEFVDFVKQALTFDRHKRPTAGELLQHPFITALEEDTGHGARGE